MSVPFNSKLDDIPCNAATLILRKRIPVAAELFDQNISISDLAQKIGDFLNSTVVLREAPSREATAYGLHHDSQASGRNSHVVHRVGIELLRHVGMERPHVVEAHPQYFPRRLTQGVLFA